MDVSLHKVEKWIGMGVMERTKDEFLGRSEHVEGKSDFVLVVFLL